VGSNGSTDVGVTAFESMSAGWRTQRSTSSNPEGRALDRAVSLPPLDRLYQSHGPAVLRRARHLLGNEADAREILHDVFASLLERPGQFSGHSSVMTFLYSMTTHHALGRLRRDRTRLRLLESNHDPEGRVVTPPGQARAELREMLLALPEELATVAVYYYLDEMTQEEIAEALGCSRQWVTKLVARLKEHTERVR
jgi:RNA polymerase sigma factor (sigma-70 family)